MHIHNQIGADNLLVTENSEGVNMKILLLHITAGKFSWKLAAYIICLKLMFIKGWRKYFENEIIYLLYKYNWELLGLVDESI